MVEIGKAVNENTERAAPRQIALFSTAWSPQIKSFRDNYMTASVTVITDRIEAAIACNVKQVRLIVYGMVVYNITYMVYYMPMSSP